jgi:HEAT repeat protein
MRTSLRFREAAFALLALALAAPASGHGGTYSAPGVSASPGPGEGPVSSPLGPAGPGPSTLPDDGSSPADWKLWWRHNQALFLALKTHVRSGGVVTGTDPAYLGDERGPQTGTLGPSEEQIRRSIVPALLGVLEHETDNDLVTGALVALAKIGDGGDAAEGARFEAAIRRFLADASQEIRETAAVSLGILASPRSIPVLAHLVWNTEEGRRMAKAVEVDYRTRSFAAYGLGLVGARSGSEIDRQIVVSILRRGLEEDDTASSDFEVACVIALGLVPLATIETPAEESRTRATPPERSRLAQLDYVAAILRDERREALARAQCPITLARLLRASPRDALERPEPDGPAAADAGPPEALARARTEIARELLERVDRKRDRNEVIQSCVLALGEIGTNGECELDARIRRTLAGAPDQLSNHQARAFATVAAAGAGGRAGQGASGPGILDAREFLAKQVYDGKSFLRPWAGLASGVMCWWLASESAAQPWLETLQRALRSSLEDERSTERLGAFALGAGLARAPDCARRLTKLLEKQLPDEPRGQVALALALLGEKSAIEPLRAIVADSRYRPELLRQAAMALAILGDRNVVPQLAGLLKEARSLATQAAISAALGFVGDRRSVDPLLALLGDRLATEKARAFAAVALGNAADKELLPWNAKIGIGLNYRAAPPTLSDPLTGTGILDIF